MGEKGRKRNTTTKHINNNNNNNNNEAQQKQTIHTVASQQGQTINAPKPLLRPVTLSMKTLALITLPKGMKSAPRALSLSSGGMW